MHDFNISSNILKILTDKTLQQHFLAITLLSYLIFTPDLKHGLGKIRKLNNCVSLITSYDSIKVNRNIILFIFQKTFNKKKYSQKSVLISWQFRLELWIFFLNDNTIKYI